MPKTWSPLFASEWFIAHPPPTPLPRTPTQHGAWNAITIRRSTFLFFSAVGSRSLGVRVCQSTVWAYRGGTSLQMLWMTRWDFFGLLVSGMLNNPCYSTTNEEIEASNTIERERLFSIIVAVTLPLQSSTNLKLWELPLLFQTELPSFKIFFNPKQNSPYPTELPQW